MKAGDQFSSLFFQNIIKVCFSQIEKWFQTIASPAILKQSENAATGCVVTIGATQLSYVPFFTSQLVDFCN